MIPNITDPSLYCIFEDKKLVRIDGSYVDALLRAGTNEGQTHSDDMLERFETTGNHPEPCIFSGMQITGFDNTHHIYQDFYTSKIEQIPSNAKI